MKTYKKIMAAVTMIENLVLALSLLVVLGLTFGNVVARYIFHHSWGFTEELTVSLFVLLSLLGAGVAARKGELVNLALVTDNVGAGAKKVLLVISNLICIAYSVLLTYQGIGRIRVDHTFSPILHISKTVFWSFVVIGGISLVLHFIENTLECLFDHANDVKKEEEE